jgi:murein DD-endopeptidase MepM/ murein hydrolase activator NlpD
LENQDKLQTEDVGDFLWPVPSHVINATFHDPDYPFKNVMQHSGIDIRASQGTPVHAAASGYVATAKKCTLASCYSYVLVIHTESLSTLYGHLSAIYVTPNQFVTKGDIIGLSGGTPGAVGSGPFVTGPHLHFEVRLNGIPVNPLNYNIN